MKNDKPLAAASDGRGPGGKFAVGNAIGKGNPFAVRAQRIRAALFRAIKPSDVEAAVKALVDSAKGGDRFALAEILDRTLGRPTTADVEQRLQALEDAMAQRNAPQTPLRLN